MSQINIETVSHAAYWISAASILWFSVVIVGLFQIVWLQVSFYPAALAKAGYYVHVASGTIFFIAGLLQFNTNLRRNNPLVHKACGLVYYGMTILSTVSLLFIAIGGSETGFAAWFTVLVLGPLWLWINWLSYKAILRGDVALHRKMNLRAFGFANTIIWMRPFLLLMVWPCFPTFVWDDMHPVIMEALKSALWLFFFIQSVAMELYLHWEDAVNGIDGSHGVSTFIHSDPFIPVSVHRMEMLNDAVLRVVFQITDSSALLITTAGQHISLKAICNGSYVIRNYTPVTTRADMESGFVDLVIRLIPNGQMSTLLLDSVKTGSNHKFSIASCHRSFDYKPNQFSTLVLVASGTGITPMINIARAVLKDQRDKTRVHIIFNVRSAEDVFFESELKELATEGSETAARQSSNKLRFTFTIRYQDSDGHVSAESILKNVIESGKLRIVLSGPTTFVKPLGMQIVQLKRKISVFVFGVTDW
ncbi:hypothetical protein BCR33DRAFT_714262 [Rhizoclosmatium globosum]|uniref:FAD-binding FR-type domain-containing protein n=1 Tax=Rhizoclosmatium globosum TaxID=329046 RepID=A0A1Y2CN78_9FUNG|nr:hypothetical protein BCR33DRAFT_714262 [Rhizoclosmatium globosum]|eukprot:ORY48489.1 hypothetical protein BCR33DRAFT_714262 [Rhizoclosmatium globosum]